MPVVTLLTDYGAGSPYPGQVKGVLRALCRATITDLTHDVPPHDVACGAYLLAAAVRAFPAGTIHLAVVDPGVGTDRLPLAIASGGQVFVGPDNGLLMVAARAVGVPRAHAIEVERFAVGPLSATFHGRDLFAPAAAAIARGLPVAQVGPSVPAPIVLFERPPERDSRSLRGQVLYRDTFGNLITNIPAAWIAEMTGPLVIAYPQGQATAERVTTYGEGAPDVLLVLGSSAGTVEIAVRGGRAADRLSLKPGEPIAILA
jgi:S-adenosylmethionine hydrolase